VWQQGIGSPPFVKASHSLQSTLLEGVKDTLHRTTSHVGEFGDTLVRLTVGFQPQDFHPPLHPRIGVVVSFPCDDLPLFFREHETAHPCTSLSHPSLM
jgi:hypothetical protein